MRYLAPRDNCIQKSFIAAFCLFAGFIYAENCGYTPDAPCRVVHGCPIDPNVGNCSKECQQDPCYGLDGSCIFSVDPEDGCDVGMYTVTIVDSTGKTCAGGSCDYQFSYAFSYTGFYAKYEYPCAGSGGGE